MADVFISYSKADRALAEALANDLSARGFDVWWDFQLYAGDDFHDMIRAEIGKAKAVIVIWSKKAVASKWVRGEAEEASDHNTLVSAHAPGFDTREVPINFRALHCEPVTNRDRVIAAVERKGARAWTRTSHKPFTAPLDPNAARGEADEQYNLAVMHEHGRGVAKNEAEAVRLYRSAADKGHAHAQNSLGVMHQDGRGVAKDEAEAVRFYRLAADQGNAYAQYNLAFMYDVGSGVATNAEEATRLYRLAADQGNAHAQFKMGIRYEFGRDVAQSKPEAARFYRLAADQGHALAKGHLAGLEE